MHMCVCVCLCVKYILSIDFESSWLSFSLTRCQLFVVLSLEKKISIVEHFQKSQVPLFVNHCVNAVF